MSIVYPLAHPSTPEFSDMVWRPEFAIATTRSVFSKRVRAYDWLGFAWVFECSLPPMTRAQAADWQAFFLRLKGTLGTFLLSLPAGAGGTARGGVGGTPRVNGTSQEGVVLITDGWTAGQSPIIRAMDYFLLESNLYAVTADANSDGSGNATLDIMPPLRESPADNAILDVTDPQMTARLLEPMSFSISTAQHYFTSFIAIEAVGEA